MASSFEPCDHINKYTETLFFFDHFWVRVNFWEFLAEMAGMDASLQDLLFQTGALVVVLFWGFQASTGAKSGT